MRSRLVNGVLCDYGNSFPIGIAMDAAPSKPASRLKRVTDILHGKVPDAVILSVIAAGAREGAAMDDPPPIPGTNRPGGIPVIRATHTVPASALTSLGRRNMTMDDTDLSPEIIQQVYARLEDKLSSGNADPQISNTRILAIVKEALGIEDLAPTDPGYAADRGLRRRYPPLTEADERRRAKMFPDFDRIKVL